MLLEEVQCGNNQSQNRDAAGNRMGSKHCELAAAVAKNCGAILSHWWGGCAAGKSSCHIGVFLMSENRHGNSPRVAGSPLAVRGIFVLWDDERTLRTLTKGRFVVD